MHCTFASDAQYRQRKWTSTRPIGTRCYSIRGPLEIIHSCWFVNEPKTQHVARLGTNNIITATPSTGVGIFRRSGRLLLQAQIQGPATGDIFKHEVGSEEPVVKRSTCHGFMGEMNSRPSLDKSHTTVSQFHKMAARHVESMDQGRGIRNFSMHAWSPQQQHQQQ